MAELSTAQSCDDGYFLPFSETARGWVARKLLLALPGGLSSIRFETKNPGFSVLLHRNAAHIDGNVEAEFVCVATGRIDQTYR